MRRVLFDGDYNLRRWTSACADAIFLAESGLILPTKLNIIDNKHPEDDSLRWGGVSFFVCDLILPERQMSYSVFIVILREEKKNGSQGGAVSQGKKVGSHFLCVRPFDVFKHKGGHIFCLRFDDPG